LALDAHRFECVANGAAGLGWRALMIVSGSFGIAHFLVVAGGCAVQKIVALELTGSAGVTAPTVLDAKWMI
jgi:hypothetical protein